MAGDRLTRVEFERRYNAMPLLKKAELIEGVVYIPSLQGTASHAAAQADCVGWLGTYRAYTPGVQAADNCTVRLDLDNEPQPDSILRISPDCGGQSRTVDDFVEGAPELVAEIAASSASYDLHDKMNVYQRSGVREYLIWRVWDRAIDWFVLRGGKYGLLKPDSAGFLKSEVFPGLWLDVAALLRDDLARVLAVAQEGRSSPEYRGFVARLQQQANSAAK